jgi:hypothetical protein
MTRPWLLATTAGRSTINRARPLVRSPSIATPEVPAIDTSPRTRLPQTDTVLAADDDRSPPLSVEFGTTSAALLLTATGPLTVAFSRPPQPRSPPAEPATQAEYSTPSWKAILLQPRPWSYLSEVGRI